MVINSVWFAYCCALFLVWRFSVFDVSGLEVDASLSVTRTATAKEATKKLIVRITSISLYPCFLHVCYPFFFTQGTPVTVDSFAAWRAKFEAEMLSNTDPFLGITLDPNVKREASRLTGREQFLMASAGNLKLDTSGADADQDDDDDDDDDDDVDNENDDDNSATAAAPAVIAHVIDANVFAAESAADLDDLEFSSDEDDR
jgi:hypothetical protein